MVEKAPGSFMKIMHAESSGAETNSVDKDASIDESVPFIIPPNSKYKILDPLHVLNLFKKIRDADIPLLMVQVESEKHPADLLLSRIPVPPVCIRPSVVSDTRAGTTEDDITMKLTEIMLVNDVLKKHKHDGSSLRAIEETWDQLQV